MSKFNDERLKSAFKDEIDELETDQHQDKIDALQSEVAELKANAVERDRTNVMVTTALMESEAEVARLKEEIERWEMQDVHESMACHAENSRLRDLLRHVKVSLSPYRESDLGLCGLYEAVRDGIQQSPVPSQSGEEL